MKKINCFLFQRTLTNMVTLLFVLGCLTTLQSFASIQKQTQQSKIEYAEYSGVVVDSQSGNPLVFASLTVDNTNISTITNAEGEFLLKVPETIKDATITVSFLGYHRKTIALSELKESNNRIALDATVTKLSEIHINLPKDAKTLVLKALSKKSENNLNEHVLMTAFYRETIKKRRKNVSLAEAIVNVYKQPYSSLKRDYIKLYKARKSTDYSKLDTVALKLQGGPFNTLYVDMMKYPEYMFTPENINQYAFSFAPSTTIGERPVYVIAFKQRDDIIEPLYYGKLFIDYKTLALTSAVYNLNVKNKELSEKLFVKRKPKDVKVYPTKASYRVDYREKGGKWYYGYSNVQLTFKVNRKGKLFNSVYSLTSEMAITDWEIDTLNEKVKHKDRLRPSIIISDEASGFSDPEFWGAYNVIEPEKSIESAIDKIRKKLDKISRKGNT